MPSATTTDTTTQPPPTTFPRSTIAALAPRAYLLTHLSTTSLRPTDSRAPSAFRPLSCNPGALTHCAGSAVVRLGDTAVVCGVQAEILLASSIADPPRAPHSAAAELASLNLLVPNVELATGCSPRHMPGGAPSAEAQTLVQRLHGLLHTTQLVDIDDLRVLYTPPRSGDDDDDLQAEPQTVAYWTLYISVHVLSLSGSASLIDAAWTAVVAALKDVRLPAAVWNADLEQVVCSERLEESRWLRLSGTPLCCTWGVFVSRRSDEMGVAEGSESDGGARGVEYKMLPDGRRAWLLADPDAFEDPLCQETVTVVVDTAWGRAKVVKMEKSGGVVLGIEQMKGLIKAAEERWKELSAIMP